MNIFNRNKGTRQRKTQKEIFLAKIGNDIMEYEAYKTDLIREIGNLEKKRADVAEKTLFNALDLQEDLDKVGLGDAVPLRRSITPNSEPITDIAGALEQISNDKTIDIPDFIKPLIKGFLANPANRQKINEKAPDILAGLTNENVKAGMSK